MATSGLVSLLLFFVGLGLFIVVLVVSIILAVSYLAGWGALSRQYRADSWPDKGVLLEEKVQRRARIGLDSYGTLVTARCFEQGIELAVAFPFLPPLFFPWQDIHDYKQVRLIPFPPGDQFYVGDRRIWLSNRLAELEKRMAPHSL